MGLLSLRSPLASLHFSHPACILHVTSLSTSPLSCTYAPRYLYSDTFFRTVSSNCTLPSPPGSPFHLHSICSVLSLFILNPLLSRTFLTLSSFSCTSCSVSATNTISFPNSMHQGASFNSAFNNSSRIRMKRYDQNEEVWLTLDVLQSLPQNSLL